MNMKISSDTDLCPGCVYYPPNLPAHAYAADDYAMLQSKTCCFDHSPGDTDCQAMRKTSCAIVKPLDRP